MFAEDPNIFMADFGVPVVYGSVQTTAIFDTPGSEVLGASLDTEYEITYVTTSLPGLKYGDQITVNGVQYLARKPLPLSDGVMSRCTLSLP